MAAGLSLFDFPFGRRRRRTQFSLPDGILPMGADGEPDLTRGQADVRFARTDYRRTSSAAPHPQQPVDFGKPRWVSGYWRSALGARGLTLWPHLAMGNADCAGVSVFEADAIRPWGCFQNLVSAGASLLPATPGQLYRLSFSKIREIECSL